MRSLEKELDKLAQQHDDALAQIDQLTHELEEAHNARQIDTAKSASSVEVERLQKELETTRAKYDNQVDATDNLKNEMEGLVDTLREMNHRQDELAQDREADQHALEEARREAKEWKERYEQAKTELHEVKTSSQLFLQAPKPDEDYMPTAPDGAIVDAHVTSFQSSIDGLLIGGR